jgi:hypothetical protein
MTTLERLLRLTQAHAKIAQLKGASVDHWIDEFEYDVIQFQNGDPWPVVDVHRWQINARGERRFVETRRYTHSVEPPKP